MTRRLPTIPALVFGLVLLRVSAAWAATTLTMDEVSLQPVNGLTVKGVTFHFQVGGVDSTDANYHSGGPGLITYVQDPSIEGNADGVLTVDLPQATPHVQFGGVLSVTTSLTPGFSVQIFDANLNSLGTVDVNTAPITSFSEALWSYTSASVPVRRLVVSFHNPGGRFAFDNLTFSVCGDGQVDPGESCDDSNTLGGDACPANCVVAPTATPTPTLTFTPTPAGPTPAAACVCTCGSNPVCTDHPISFNAIDCQNSCASMGCTYTHYCSGTSTYPTECAFCLTLVISPTPTLTPIPTRTFTPTVTFTNVPTATPTPTWTRRPTQPPPPSPTRTPTFVFTPTPTSTPTPAATQSRAEQGCVTTLIADGIKVNGSQGKENSACVKSAGKGRVANPQACLTADLRGKVFAAELRTIGDETRKCIPPPDFGFAGSDAVNAAAHDESVGLVADVFGSNLGFGAVGCSSDKAGCTCQAIVSKDYEKITAKKLSEFQKCVKTTIKQGATDRDAIESCVTPAGIAADANGAIDKAIAKLSTDVATKCPSNVFPGLCSAASRTDLAGCIDVLVECRVCRTINAMANLDVDCDLFDDGTANESCQAAIRCGQTVNATLDSSDTQLFGDGTFTDVYTFTLSQPASVEFTLDAPGFDPFLYLFGPDGSAVGTSSVQASLPAGTYSIVANNFSVLPAGSYPYALTMSCQ